MKPITLNAALIEARHRHDHNARMIRHFGLNTWNNALHMAEEEQATPDKEPAMNTAEILAKAADLAYDDDNWPKNFERYDAELMRWVTCHSEAHFFYALKEKRGIRLTPETYQIDIPHMPKHTCYSLSYGLDKSNRGVVKLTLAYANEDTAELAHDTLMSAL